MNLDAAVQTFLNEARELLQQMEQGALQLESNPADTESINAMFRAAHTIKGSAGLFGFDEIVAFTHVLEDVLDKVRAGSLPVTPLLIAAVLQCSDNIGGLVEAVAGNSAEAGSPAKIQESLDKLNAVLGKGPAGADAGKALSGGAAPADAAEPSDKLVDRDTWQISVRFGKDALRHGMDPMSFISYLGKLGELVHVITLLDGLPAIDEMDPESCYLGFEIALRSTVDKAAIENVFEFVREDCTLRIMSPPGRLEHYGNLIRDLPQEESLRVGEILIQCGALTENELRRALVQQRTEVKQRPVGQILVEQNMVHPEVVDAALQRQKEAKKVTEARSIRVDADKLDRLINLVGELVIAGASATLLSRKRADSELIEAAELMARLVEEIRESALRLRMVQIGETFSKFRRVVRDVSRELNKEIDLQITGGETELDKGVVEKIGDPLTHLVRNSLDHGIEPREKRLSRGKPAHGTLRLHALHDSGNVVIEVSDDGGGLPREKILGRARERGLVPEGTTPTDNEILNLIFAPGFSTAEKVTDLSGRGVGMDVVKRNIEALRGTVELESKEGEGTKVRIRLPLTMAIIDGFLVGVGQASYVVPLDVVVECVEISDKDREQYGEHNYLNLRGEVLPFLRLRDLFQIAQAGLEARRENVVVVQYAGAKAGLVVDELMGEFQTVIKPLGRLFRNVRGISGSTVLGSGEVALILDVQSLVQHAVGRGAGRGAAALRMSAGN